MKKRGQTGIIVVVILIILVLVSVVILWNVVGSLIKKSTSQVSTGQFSLSGNIKYNLEPTNSSYLNVSVKRGAGEGDITGVKIIFDFADGTRRTYTNNTIYPLPLETKVYLVNGSYLDPKMNPSNFSAVKKVSIYFITKDGSPTREIDNTNGPSSGSSSASSGSTPILCNSNLECDDSNVCTNDVCNNPGTAGSTCSHNNNAVACNDGNLCTINDVCSLGTCSGTQKTCTSPQTCNPSNGNCEGCLNDCATSGATQCSGNNIQTCGNYDADSCLEWNTTTVCSGSTPNCISGVCGKYRRNCKEIFDSGVTANGVYNIDPLQTGSNFTVYCWMSYSGGGWTLAMKIDGNKTTFDYNSNYWTTANTYNSSASNFDYTESKLDSFNLVNFTQVLVGMKDRFNDSDTARYMTISRTDTSLRNTFSSGYIPINKGRTAWQTLFPTNFSDYDIWANCSDGFNAVSSYQSVRIGMLLNNEGDCNSPDAGIGIGFLTTSHVSWGWGLMRTSGGGVPETQPPMPRKTAYAYIFVR